MRIPPKADVELRNSLQDIHQEIAELKRQISGVRQAPPEVKTERRTEVETFRDVLVKGNLRVDGDITFGGLNGPEIGGLVGTGRHSTQSLDQEVVQVNGSLAVLNALSADTIRARVFVGASATSGLGGTGSSVSLDSCYVSNAGNQSVTNSTELDLAFDTEEHDTAGFHDGINTDRITIPATGVYAFGAHVLWEANGAGDRYLWISLNDPVAVLVANILVEVTINAVDNSSPFMHVSSIRSFGSGDILRAQVYQTSGGNINVMGTTSNGPRANGFWCYRLS